MKFKGAITALVTPFKDGELDEKSLKKLVAFQLENGIEGFVISGSTGESPCLSQEEKKRVFSLVKSEVAGQVPLIVGTGSNSTETTSRWTREAEAWGADAALVVVPYYNKPPQRGLVQHFSAVAKATGMPVILYNVPGRTITGFTLETIETLSKIKNIVGIKEATGDVAFGASIAQRCGREFLLTSGDDGTFVELMAQGGHGVISVVSHLIPKKIAEWCGRQARKEGVQDSAKYEEIISSMGMEANPIPVKAALYLMGIISSPELRLPLVALEEGNMKELRHRMVKAGIIT